MNNYFWVWFPLWIILFMIGVSGPAEPAVPAVEVEVAHV